jgi:hypothetical protein
MFNFTDLVESLLLEDENTFLQSIQQKVPNINVGVLKVIYDELNKQQRYIAGERWEPYVEFTPVFNAIVMALGGTYQSARSEIANLSKAPAGGGTPPGNNISTFYDLVETKFQNQPTSKYQSLIKPLDQYTTADWNNTSSDVKNTYLQALKKQSDRVLIQNVWPQIENMTITDSVTNILKNRLTSLERMKLNFIVPLNSLQSELGNFDNIMIDVIKNYKAYSSGSKKYSKNVTEVLQNINVIPEDFVKIVTHTIDLYKLVITSKFRNMADKVVASSLTNENIAKFAKNGIATFDVNGNISESRDKYILSFIEKGNTDPGNKLIEQIKSMSTGIRVKDQAWQKLLSQRLNYATQALGAIAALGGAKLYGGQ